LKEKIQLFQRFTNSENKNAMKEKRVYRSEIDNCKTIIEERDSYLNNPIKSKLVYSDELTEPFQFRMTLKQRYALAEKCLNTKKSRNEILRECAEKELFGEQKKIDFLDSGNGDLTDELKRFLKSKNFSIVIEHNGNWKVESTTRK